MDEKQNVTARQKKIALAQSEHVEAVVAILQESVVRQKLVGDSEYATVVNAVTLDAQSQLIMDFVQAIDRIKQGGLLTTESNG